MIKVQPFFVLYQRLFWIFDIWGHNIFTKMKTYANFDHHTFDLTNATVWCVCIAKYVFRTLSFIILVTSMENLRNLVTFLSKIPPIPPWGASSSRWCNSVGSNMDGLRLIRGLGSSAGISNKSSYYVNVNGNKYFNIKSNYLYYCDMSYKLQYLGVFKLTSTITLIFDDTILCWWEVNSAS